MTNQEFINLIAPIAIHLKNNGSYIFPSIRIAQAALETGWKIPSWNNVVGFKVGSGKTNEFWKGKSVSTKTWEVYDGIRYDNVTANWRAYDSIEDCFRDQDLLFNLSRYERVRKSKTADEQANMLYACGYASDPKYASKLISIINSYGLTKFDSKAGDEYMMKPEDANKIISFLQAGWKVVEGYKDARNEFNYLANELRKASGQKVQ